MAVGCSTQRLPHSRDDKVPAVDSNDFDLREVLVRMASDNTERATEAFNQLHGELFEPTARFLKSKTPKLSIENCEDIAQEALLKLWERRENFVAHSGQEARGYFWKTVRNHMIDTLRKMGAKPQTASLCREDDTQVDVQDHNSCSPVDVAIQNEEQTILALKLARLPTAQASAIRQHLEGATLPEIAHLSESPQRTIQSRIRVGVASLQENTLICRELPSNTIEERRLARSLRTLRKILAKTDDDTLSNFAAYALRGERMATIARRQGCHVSDLEASIRVLQRACQRMQGRGKVSAEIQLLIIGALTPIKEPEEQGQKNKKTTSLSREELDYLIKGLSQDRRQLITRYLVDRVPLKDLAQEQGLSSRDLCKKFDVFTEMVKRLKGPDVVLSRLDCSSEMPTASETRDLSGLDRFKLHRAVGEMSRAARVILAAYFVDRRSINDIEKDPSFKLKTIRKVIQGFEKKIGNLFGGQREESTVRAALIQVLTKGEPSPNTLKVEAFSSADWCLVMEGRNDLHREINQRLFIQRQMPSQIAKTMEIPLVNVNRSKFITMRSLHELRGRKDFNATQVSIEIASDNETSASQVQSHRVYRLRKEFSFRISGDGQKWLRDYFVDGKGIDAIARLSNRPKIEVKRVIAKAIQAARKVSGLGRYSPSTLAAIEDEVRKRRQGIARGMLPSSVD